MPCYRPLDGWYSKYVNPTGKKSIVFDIKQTNDPFNKIRVPCGKCIGCKLDYSRKWAIRCLHESEYHAENSFLTLTYDNENLPEKGSLNKRDYVLFLKRLRKNLGIKFRYYVAGEYGDKKGRPHYHICVFGWVPKDLYMYEYSQKTKIPVYRSPELEKIWGKGRVIVGQVTLESAAYVARYCLKKTEGSKYEKYKILGEKEGEFVAMSRMPGLGYKWIEQYKSDVYPHDYVEYKGKKSKPPRYYDNYLQKTDTIMYNNVKSERETNAQKCKKSRRDLAVAERVKLLQINKLKRSYEYGSA